MKKLLYLGIVLLLLLTLPICAAADNAYSLLDDGAGLLTDAEARELNAYLDAVSTQCNMTVAVVTRNGIAEEIGDFADRYFDSCYGSSTDGIVLALDMEQRSWYISTNGYGRTAVPDSAVNALAKTFQQDLSSGAYYGAFTSFADGVLSRTLTAREKGLTEKSAAFAHIGAAYIAVPLAIAFVIALITVLIMKGKLKTVRHNRLATGYTVPGSLRVNVSRDLYLFTTTTRTPRQTSSGGGGGHSGSHGGGGGSF